MKAFRVCFYKEVCGDIGNVVDARQGAFDVLAADERSAVAEAQRRFASERRIFDWSIHADRFEVGPAGGASSTPSSAWTARSDVGRRWNPADA